MRWRDYRRSTNVEDRRSRGPGMVVGGGLGMLVIAGLFALLGGDLGGFLSQIGGGGGSSAPVTAEEKELGDFVSTVLADTEDVWKDLFQKMGKTYQEPKLVLFRGSVDSACGRAGASVGPFYCPSDRSVYIDLSFYDELRRRFGAPGDFAQAYVIAHEVGHHVQHLLGIADRIRSLQERADETEANRLSVKMELHADYLAGVWAHHAQRTRQILEQGDLEEALQAAAAIGDDTLQKRSQGHVVPDSFTHGTSAQRVEAFRRGFQSGEFAGDDPLR